MKLKKMIRCAIVAFLPLISLSLFALPEAEKTFLWPDGKMPYAQGHQVAAYLDAVQTKGFDRAANNKPYLQWYQAPTNKTGACVLLIVGGGYEICAKLEWYQKYIDQFLKEGVVCATLAYRTPRPRGLPIYQSAWADAQRAVKLMRREAAARGFDPEKIGVFSMSAGSHLAVLLATSALTPAYQPIDEIDATPCHVNWAIPSALAYALTDGIGVPNTRMGDGIDVKLDKIFKFDAKTAPMCLIHGGNDPYSPTASTQVYRKLREKKIPAEVHIIPDKQHVICGFERGIEFLRQMGFLGKLQPEVPITSRYPHDKARATYEKKNVWPEGRTPDFRANQCVPYLEWHIPSNLTTKAIQLMWSGGSYGGNSPDIFEVQPARRFLNEKGMTVVTVKYRCPRPSGLAKHTTAWQDIQRVIRLVRSEAAARGLDPNRIGIMGSSAGGHLALMAATSARHPAYRPIDKIDQLPCNVQWSINIYPAYALTDGAEQKNVTGGNPDSARLVPEFSFDPATPPMLFIHGDADGWAAMNSVKAWEQLRRMGIQGELHTLALRDHCFQRAAAPGTGSYTWLERVWEFLTAKGFNR